MKLIAPLLHSEKAVQYAIDVVDGLIPACKWVKLSCQRHLDDLESSQREDYPYRFDVDAAERVCEFAELMPHVKGKWARGDQRMELSPWQSFLLCGLFGWLRKADGFRRFRKVYWKIPRKNGKSIMGAIIGLYMFKLDGEYGAEVYSGATSEKQAWEVFRPAKQMLEKSKDFTNAAQIEVWAKSFACLADGSRFEPIIGKPGDGASPSCAIVDEYHEHEGPDLVDTMETGMGARDQPILLMITTAGYNIAGPCYDQELEARRMLERSQDIPDLFAIMYGIDPEDNWADPKAITKANPNYGISVGSDFLLAQQRAAILNPAHATRFRTKHLNDWCSGRDALVNMVRWSQSEDAGLVPTELTGEQCWLAIDLASKVDLCASGKVFKKILAGKPHYYLFCRYYLPEETIESDEHNSANYRKWRDQGHLIMTDGATVDFDLVVADAIEDLNAFSPEEVVFDPSNSTWMAQKITAQGGKCIEFPQNQKNMAPATDEFISAVMDNRVHHDGNPITTWCVGNLVARRGGGKLPLPTKQKPQFKIDGAVALIMGIGRAAAEEIKNIMPDDYELGSVSMGGD